MRVVMVDEGETLCSLLERVGVILFCGEYSSVLWGWGESRMELEVIGSF